MHTKNEIVWEWRLKNYQKQDILTNLGKMFIKIRIEYCYLIYDLKYSLYFEICLCMIKVINYKEVVLY